MTDWRFRSLIHRPQDSRQPPDRAAPRASRRSTEALRQAEAARVTDPFQLILYENVAYLASDARRAEALSFLGKRSARSPRRSCGPARDAARDRRRRDPPGRHGREAAGDRARSPSRNSAEISAPVLRLPPREAIRELRKFPSIGEPGAEKILLFTGARPILALESNGLRVLLRLGFGKEEKSYAKSYRSRAGGGLFRDPGILRRPDRGPPASAPARTGALQAQPSALRGVPPAARLRVLPRGLGLRIEDPPERRKADVAAGDDDRHGSVEPPGLSGQARRDGGRGGGLHQVLVMLEHPADALEDLLFGDEGDAADPRAQDREGPRARFLPRCRRRRSPRRAGASRPPRARARAPGPAISRGCSRPRPRPGRAPATTKARPPDIPAPPTGRTKFRASGISSRISSASVPPLPAMIASSSKAEIQIRPSRAASASAHSSVSS